MVQYLNNSGFNQWNQMKAEKKPSRFSGFLGWLALFLLAWWIMGIWFKPKTVEQTNITPVTVEQSNVAAFDIENEDISLKVQGLRLSDISLNKHKKESKSDERIKLLANENNFIEVGFVSSDAQTPNINTKWDVKSDGMYWNAKGLQYVRNISVDGYVIKITDTIKNNSNAEISIAPYVQIAQSVDNQSSVAVETGGVVYANSDLDYIHWNNLNKKSFAYSSVNASFGFAEQYWETVASVDAKDQTISMKKSGDLYLAQSNVASVKIAPKTTTQINTYVFAGPRISDVLKSASNNIPGLSKTMDYGWFWFFAAPMLWMINWLFALVGNYGVAIILMTLVLRLLMWPLTRKSYASTMAMQKMQPELQRVQKLYANDKARLQMEMMRIYQTHKTSPMAGCLPMLIQIPIFFALYKALLVSVPMRSAQFLWISDLAIKDPWFILPILMGLTMWLQQYFQTPKTTSTNTNDVTASTQRVMRWMPIIFTVMFAWMPAGLVLYWTVSNVFSIAQMYIIKKTMK